MKWIRRPAGWALRAALRPLGFTLAPLARRAEYIDAGETCRAAAERGLSVSEYVEELWDERGISDRVVEEMAACGSLPAGGRICEIGAGTGRFLERVLRRCRPETYDVYELDDGWAAWLESSYPVQRRPADGKSLAATPDACCSLVHAHGVFVYLKALTSFEYFAEMARVCAPGGHLVFDIYADDAVDLGVIDAWLAHPERYQVILPRALVLEFFAARGFEPVHRFDNRCFRGESQYLVLRRREG